MKKSVRKIFHHLITNIDTGVYKPGEPLPTVKTISRTTHVYINAVCEALQLLKQHGILHGKPGHPYTPVVEQVDPNHRINELAGESDTAAAAGWSKWRRIADEMHASILSTTRDADNFPSLKELQITYHANYATIKKALEYLRTNGVLCTRGRNYAVVRPAYARQFKKIRLITFTPVTRQLSLSGLNEDYVRLLETECSQAQLKLDIIGFTYAGEYFFTHDRDTLLSGIEDDESVVGYIYLITNINEWHVEILKVLSHVKKPCAYIDVTGKVGISKNLKRRNVRLFTVALSPRPARTVGHYLLGRNHRTIAYISPFHKAIWSQNRLFGFQDVFDKAGVPDGVRAIVNENSPVVFEVKQTASHKKSNWKQMRRYYAHWRNKLPQFYCESLDYIFDFYLPMRVLPKQEFDYSLQALFDAALNLEGCTAWVAANDEIAIAALQYLRRKGIIVPGDVSVIGFDDTREAMNEGVTSFNFNMRAVSRLSVAFLMNTQSVKAGSRSIEVEGHLVERMTVADAPQ
ncbi:MAG: GntR family transcriptional regulator [Chitinivibrionales bacterium]|nr:GntR family transcriptional regulator [Chitinivibrionales bacterium]